MSEVGQQCCSLGQRKGFCPTLNQDTHVTHIDRHVHDQIEIPVFIFKRNTKSRIYFFPSSFLLLKISTCSFASHVWLFRHTMGCRPASLFCPWISQARILKWVAIFFSRASSWARDWTRIYLCLLLCREILYCWTTRGAHTFGKTDLVAFSNKAVLCPSMSAWWMDSIWVIFVFIISSSWHILNIAWMNGKWMITDWCPRHKSSYLEDKGNLP